ncbi:hypothetical protein M0208_06955 [Sphingomonas sp. SUN019]|uniref:hypothetical protein n=1 Tax=Sphingomonas sp. SUN019 TaxID=2937788 RepID=UPI002164C72B|nr:hypothetical protein [Sphingomonas sp. SUN019]UVO50272.1 hypothetical protein M0208_06955 [Sphingomonas sp. SUN019]
MTAAFALLGKLTPQWLGALTWPQAIVIGIAGAFTATFVFALALAIGAYGFRLLRPIQMAAPGQAEATSGRYDEAHLIARVNELARLVRAVIDDYQRMSAVEARFNDALDGLKAAVQIEFREVRADIIVIERKANESIDLTEKVEQVRVDGATNRKDLDRIERLQKDERERRLGSFHAIGTRERLTDLETAIVQDAADLYDQLKTGEIYDDSKWQQWENIHAHWKSVLDEWLNSATWYGLAVKERTLFVDDEKYGLDWSVSETQFPSAEAVRRFKKFRIIHAQWESVVPSVKSGLQSVAYNGLTDLEARSGRPAG